MTKPRQTPSFGVRFGKVMSTQVATMPTSASIGAVLKHMIDRRVSCILIHDHSDAIVGILTERDVLRHFALLDVDDKLTRRVATIMTRPVRFVQLASLRADLIKLHQDHGHRHFPVIDGAEPTTKNVIGMITMTDLARQYLGEMAFETGGGSVTPVQFIGETNAATQVTCRALAGFGYAVSQPFQALEGSIPSLIDIDGIPVDVVRRLLVDALSHRAVAVFTGTTRPDFKELAACVRHGHAWVDKPIDVMLVDWLLRRGISK